MLSNILFHELDKELEKQKLKYVRYAVDFSIYCKTRQTARRVGNKVFMFLKDKLKLTINLEKSGIRKPVQFEILVTNSCPPISKGIKSGIGKRMAAPKTKIKKPDKENKCKEL